MTDKEKVEFTAEQQVEVDRLMGKVRAEGRDKAKTEFTAAQAKATEEAERAALEASNEWQKIATEQKSRITSLEPLAVKVKEYEVLFDGMLADRVKALGDAAKKAVAALPESMTSGEKLTWLDKNVGLFPATSDGVGTPKRPVKPAGDKTDKTVKTFKTPIRL